MKSELKHLSIVALILTVSILFLALTVEYASLSELTNESTSIVYGKVKSAYSKWEGTNIYTYTRIQVYGDIKGNLKEDNEFYVKQLGGTVSEISQEISGSPKLKQNAEVFLFLVKWKNNFWIHSIILGFYEVIEIEGEKLAVNNFNNVHLVDSKTGKSLSVSEDIKTSYNLSSLISEVKTIINKEK